MIDPSLPTMSASATVSPDIRSPKSPKRFFFNFSREPLPPLPPLPSNIALSPVSITTSLHTPNSSFSSVNSSTLGHGAQVVRRPSDARREMRQPLTAGLSMTSSLSKEDLRRPPTPTSAPMLRIRPSQPNLVGLPPSGPVTIPVKTVSTPRNRPTTLKVETSLSSTNSSYAASNVLNELDFEIQSRRSTARPPLRPNPPRPFYATLVAHSTRPSPTSASHMFITLSFGFSMDEPPKNDSVTIPWENLRSNGGHLAHFIALHLTDGNGEQTKPEMTDGESAEESDLESDYGLGALLRYV